MTLGAETHFIRVVEEGKVVRTQPIVSENEVGVAVHIEFHEGGLLIEAAED